MTDDQATPATPQPAPTATPKPQPPAQAVSQAKADADVAREAGDSLATWKAEARKWEAQAKENHTSAEALEGQMTQMREAFAAALGQKPDKKVSVEDMVTGLQEQFSTMQRTALVATIARESELTAKEDIEALEGAKDEAAMRRIADRLKAVNASAPGTPKPDRTQGGTGQQVKPDLKPGMDRLRHAYSSSNDN